MTVRAIAFAIVCCSAVGAYAQDDASASAEFRAALELAAANDPGAIDAFERLGARRPITRWTDDAWSEAARLAELGDDYARARRALEQVIALGGEDRLAQRARSTLSRLTAMTGNGAWDAVAKEHERLADAVFGGDDPRAELAQLEALVGANPRYPRANAMRRVIAIGWEQEGDGERALRWYRDAAAAGTAEPGRYADLELVRALIRAGLLDDAERRLADLGAIASVDRDGLAAVRGQLAIARQRSWVRRGLWALMLALVIGAGLALRREVGSWRGAGRRIVRPPSEAVFLIPIGAILIVVAYMGNPLIAHAVRTITLGGVAIAWISGVLLEATRARRGSVGLARMAVHGLIGVVAVASLAYLAVDAEHLLDFLRETWRGGPSVR
ncbi:MAG: hypothetical protein JWP01_3183 [Myxococcales bacterium]|nr:hypothetical protein [Myxococcales bacterium]